LHRITAVPLETSEYPPINSVDCPLNIVERESVIGEVDHPHVNVPILFGTRPNGRRREGIGRRAPMGSPDLDDTSGIASGLDRHHSESQRSDRSGLASRWRRLRRGLSAPARDLAARPFERGRERAIERLDLAAGDRVSLLGWGTGLDLRYIPDGVSVTAGTSPRRWSTGRGIGLRNSGWASTPTREWDGAALRGRPVRRRRGPLLLAVVPEPGAVLAEPARPRARRRDLGVGQFVPGGRAPSLLRRAINPVTRVLFADVTRQLGPMLAGTDLVAADREASGRALYRRDLRPAGEA
jgi:hypothetical protein